MVRRRIGGALGVLVAILAGILATTVPVRDFEARTTLPVLLALRGPVAPPPRALVVVIGQSDLAALSFHADRLDEAAPGLAACLGRREMADLAGLSAPGRLPRSVHACALDILVRAGARTVAIDIFFSGARAAQEGDLALAAALSRVPQAVILERVERDPGVVGVWRRRLPEPVFAEVARTAHFSLGEAGGVLSWRRHPSIPGAVALPDAVAELLEPGRPAPPAEQGEVPVLLYGPPGAVPVMALLDLFALPPALPADLDRRAVFIGAGAEADGFPKSAPAAASRWPGVEIAATAVLNLLEDRRLTRLPRWGEGLAVALLSLVLHGLGRLPRPRRALAALVLASGLWCGAGAAAFLGAGLLLPLAVPVLVLVPLHALSSQLRRLVLLRGLARQLLPAPVFLRLEVERHGDRMPDREEMASVLIADMVGSTRLGESMAPADFAVLMKRFVAILDESVNRERGFVVRFQGDGVYALFPVSVTGPDHAARAVAAAGRIVATLAALNRDRPGAPPVRVRIGLNTGMITAGMITVPSRISFDAFGDVVNVTARLEALGKELFPKEAAVILASGETRAAAGPGASKFISCGRRVLRDRPGEIEVFRVTVPAA